eukprot:8147635-Pyramimonas_sp.AAC.1
MSLAPCWWLYDDIDGSHHNDDNIDRSIYDTIDRYINSKGSTMTSTPAKEDEPKFVTLPSAL